MISFPPSLDLETMGVFLWLLDGQDANKAEVKVDPVEVGLKQELDELYQSGSEAGKTDPALALSTGYWPRRR